MRIAHIFNAVDTNSNKLYLNNGCFDIDYIDSIIECFNNKKEICELNNNCNNLNSEAQKSLFPIKDKDIIDQYDDEKIKNILESFNSDIIYLINGDFFGIQNFIFSNLSTKRAAKILRARSAMVQLITKAISDILEKELNAKLVLFGAGKFLMISEKINNLIEIEQELNNKFYKKYFGESGIILNSIPTTKNDIENQNSKTMKNTLINLGRENEKSKYKKFKNNLKNPIIKIFENARSEDEICDFCKKRIKIQEACEVCENEIKLGTLLTKKDFLSIKIEKENYILKNNEVLILNYKNNKYIAQFDNTGEYDISNEKMKNIPKWPLKAYVPMSNGKIKTFEEIEDNKSGLMVLKADVDRLGKTFREFYFNSFKKFNRLSRELNFFFANYIPYIISQNNIYRENIYIVFTGGDDLFLIGRYDVIVNFAKELREKFYKFSLQKATLSIGLIMFKSSTPISYVSEWADKAEKEAKKVIDKKGNDRNGISIFDKTMKFDEFIEIEEKIEKILEMVNINTNVLYKLVEIIKMADRLYNSKMKNIKDSLWISKLFYLAKNRNYKVEFTKELKDLIEKYQGKILPSLYLQIYKRRDYGTGY